MSWVRRGLFRIKVTSRFHSSHVASGSKIMSSMCAEGRITGTLSIANLKDLRNIQQSFSELELPKSAIDTPAGPKSAVFLFSKGLAPYLDPKSAFLTQTLNQMFRSSLPSRLRAIIAVVDRVPATRKAHEPDMFDQSDLQAIDDCGTEGLSFLIADDHDLNIQTVMKSAGEIETGKSFLAISSDHGSKPMPCTVKLPVANTLFENGKFNTFLYTEWTRISDNYLEVTDSADVLEASAGFPTSEESTRSFSRLAIPFVPLTGMRRIEEGLGNVIRKVSDPHTGAILPASAELQHELNSRKKRGGQIFAIVMPPAVYMSLQDHLISDELLKDLESEDVDLKSLDTHGTATAIFKHLLFHIQNGATIRRVVGGGGEWGDRASLVTLEPNEPFELHGARHNEDDREMSFIQRLNSSDVAPVGHYIQFFTTSSESNLLADLKEMPLVKFGCISEDYSMTTGGDMETIMTWDKFGGLSTIALGIEISSAEESETVRAAHVDVHGASFTLGRMSSIESEVADLT